MILNDKVYLLKKGRDGKGFITFADSGKIIIPVNKVGPGYVKLTKLVKEKENCYLVEAENVICDFYMDIDYETFKKVLVYQGYKIGYELPFQSPHDLEGCDKEEMQIFAYDLESGIIIVGETFYGKKSFNVIEVFCPNLKGNSLNHPLIHIGGGHMAVFNLLHGYKQIPMPLMSIRLLKGKSSPVWPDDESPNLWHYADDNYRGFTKYQNGRFGIESHADFWLGTIDRILMVDPEIEKLFTSKNDMAKVFACRGKDYD